MKKYVMVPRRIFVFLVSSTLLSIVLLLNFAHQVAAKESGEDSYSSLRTFTDVIALVQKNYVNETKMDDLVEGAVKGMLSALDPHSSYLPPDGYKELQVETKGEFGGLGIEITVKDGILTVVSPIEDSPAARAGVLPGDQIIKIGDEYTRDLTLVDAVKKMRGPKGSPIGIAVHRDGIKELIPLTVVRDVIKVKSIRYRMLDEGFGYVRLAQFQEGSAEEFAEALKEMAKKLKEKKLNGLVLDLRNNPGGLLTQAIRVSDLFLEDGLVVYTDGRLESQKQKYYAHRDGDEPTYPLVVLINGGSASASEIVAGALQDSGRALIIGTQSFGKGSVQTILPMDGGAALRLTTALYFTRSGRSIQAQGITPDIVVAAKKPAAPVIENNGEEPAFPKERDLPGAIKNPKLKDLEKSDSDQKSEEQKDSKKEKSPLEPQPGSREAMEMELKELLKIDPQLEEALRLLKTWHVFKGKPTVEARNQLKDAA